MLRSTPAERSRSLHPSLRLTAVFLLALFIIATCVSCGGSSKNGDKSDTETETSKDMDIETTKTKADLTQEMYDKIEMGMSYKQVVDIIGQGPNEVKEEDDPVRDTGKVTTCTWMGKEESSEYPQPPQLDVSFYEGEVCSKESTSI